MTLQWVLGPQPTSPPRAASPAPVQRAAPSRPIPHAPPPFPCPPGTVWDGSECAPAKLRHLGLPSAVQQVHAKGILVAWGASPGVSPPITGYGLGDMANPAWTERDGAMLHAFAQWWTGTPQLNPSADKVDASGVVVAELTDAHLAALDAWLASQGQKVPGAQQVDVAASKALLVVWGKTDGAKQTGAIADYGMTPYDLAPAWTTRDTTELSLFQAWWNAEGKPPIATAGALDVPSSNALKAWFADRLASVPSGWLAPPAQPSAGACPSGQVWDDTNKVCQPAPAAAVAEPPAAKSSTVWWVLGGLAVLGAAALVVSSRAVGSAMRANPEYGPVAKSRQGYYVSVRGGDRELYGPYPTLKRAKTFARIGAKKGKHDRVVLHGGKVVRHYRAGTGESLVHENPAGSVEYVARLDRPDHIEKVTLGHVGQVTVARLDRFTRSVVHFVPTAGQIKKIKRHEGSIRITRSQIERGNEVMRAGGLEKRLQWSQPGK